MQSGPFFLGKCAWAPASAGTGNFVVDTVKPGFYLPDDCRDPVVVDTAWYPYFAVSDDGTEHEEGFGPWDEATQTLSRTIIRNSSNSGAIVTFTNPPTVYMGNPTATFMAVASGSVPITVETVPSYASPLASPPSGFYITPQAVAVFSGGAVTMIQSTVPCLIGDYGLTISTDITDITEISSNLGSTSAFGSQPFGNVTVDANQSSGLTTINFPFLTTCGFFSYSNAPNLTTLNLPLLKYGSFSIDLDVDGATSLSGLSLPSFIYGNVNIIDGPVSANFTTASFPAMVGGFIGLHSLPALATVDFSSFNGGSMSLRDIPLTTIDLSSYEGFIIGDDAIDISNCINLTSIDISSCVLCSPLDLYDNLSSLTTITFSTGVAPNFDLTIGNTADLSSLTTLDMSGFTTLGNISVNAGAALTTFNASACLTARGLGLNNLPSLTSVDLSALTTIVANGDGIDFETLEALTGALDLSSLVTSEQGMFFFDVAVSSIDFSALVTNSGNGIGFDTMPNLTSLDFPALTSLVGLPISTMPALATFSAAACTDLGADNAPSVSFQGCDVLTSIDFSAVVTFTGGLTVQDCPLLTAFDFPALTVANLTSPQSWTFQSCDVLASITADLMTDFGTPSEGFPYLTIGTGVPLLTSLSFPAAVNFGGITWVMSDSAITSISLPAVTDLGSLSPSNVDPTGTLSSIDISSLVNCYGAFSFGGVITTFAFPSSLLLVGGNVVALANLDQTSVDGILVKLAGLDGTGGTTSYDNLLIDLTGANSTPSATGLTAKATLEGRGNTVNVN